MRKQKEFYKCFRAFPTWSKLTREIKTSGRLWNSKNLRIKNYPSSIKLLTSLINATEKEEKRFSYYSRNFVFEHSRSPREICKSAQSNEKLLSSNFLSFSDLLFNDWKMELQECKTWSLLELDRKTKLPSVQHQMCLLNTKMPRVSRELQNKKNGHWQILTSIKLTHS